MSALMHKARLVAATALVLAGCSHPLLPIETGLTGVVVRGPVTPVCRIDVPCDAPFSANFTVELNGRAVSQFRSDADGRFTVSLEPGRYQVTPQADAPIMAPPTQRRTVDVGPNGLTYVRLEFDTGIR
jgi:hypothetical protein